MNIFFLVLFISISTTFNNQNLIERLQSVVNNIPNSTKSSIYILNANTGEDIYKQNITESMIPASNTKLFTTAAALKTMGPTYKISTKILINNLELKNGIVEGNLYIQGFGNPTFRTKDLDSLIDVVKDYGI